MTKLMLVEDDNNLREIYEARLQAEGYTIVSAHDGEEALVVAKAEKPDLIISDVMMPKISGFEMLDILRNTDELKDVKVIMLTALGQSDDQQRADRLGADRYLVKSQVTLEDIVKVTHELLGDADGSAPAADAPAPDPTPAPDPAPAPDPVPAPDPTPSADPPADEPADKPTDTQSTAQEEADVEAKIEDFVAGATDDANATPVDPPADEPTEEPEPKDEPAEASDVQAEPSSAPLPEPEVPDPADEKPSGEKKIELSDDDKPQPKKVGGERVIQPIDAEPKKDLDQLLAEEEAKESSPPVGSTVMPPEPGAKGAGHDPVDPNNIAL
jgi:CheY-like chemotaxis protein